MCFGSVELKDKKHRNITNHFGCGHCSACLQQRSSYRSRLIRSHKPFDKDGKPMTCFFVTLTYNNDTIPFVLKSKFLHAYDKALHNRSVEQVFIFRLKDPYNPSHVSSNAVSILDLVPDKNVKPFGQKEFDKLSPLCVKEKDGSVGIVDAQIDYDDSIVTDVPISVAYNADWKSFVKRLREYLRARYGRCPLSYFFCPEYGPTTSRFHIHALIWVPQFITESSFKTAVSDNWKYADRDLTEKYVEVAIDPASYVSSYVNCSADVSRVLLSVFKLRPSHSFNFGYTDRKYSAAQVYTSFVTSRSTRVYELHKTKSGAFENRLVPYPSSIIYRYFPKIKGFNLCSYNSLLDAYQDPEKFLRFAQDNIDFESKDLSAGICSDFHSLIYLTNVRMIDGHSLPISSVDRKSFINRLHRCYRKYFKPLGLSFRDYGRLCVDILIHHQLDLINFIYTSGDIPPEEVVYNFNDALEQEFYSEEDLRFRSSLSSFSFDSFLSTIQRNSDLNIKFHKNIKHRKLNYFNHV